MPDLVYPHTESDSGVTLARQDQVQDILKESERKIAVVEVKTRPPKSESNPQQGQEHNAQQQEEGPQAHPFLADKAYFSGMDESVLPPNSPEGQEAYRQLQNELALQKRLQNELDNSIRPGR